MTKKTKKTKKITFEVPDDFDIAAFQPPPGWKVVSPGKGGRPRIDLKRIAALLARLWRTGQMKDSPSASIEWICQHWIHHGIHDDARARQRIKEGSALLDGFTLIPLDDGWFCTKIPTSKGSRAYAWLSTMHAAVELESVEQKVELFSVTPTIALRVARSSFLV